MEIIAPLAISFPGKILFGNGTISQLSKEVQRWNLKRVLIVTTEPLLVTVNRIADGLRAAHLEVEITGNINREPHFSDLRSLVKQVEKFNPDVVVGIGGGSVLDVAKLVAAQLGNEQSLEEYVGIDLLRGRSRMLVCVPTTSGTGSEASPNAILVDDSDGQKKGIISPYLVPDIVIVDPTLTFSVPASVTAATGIDALTHCLEAYTNKFAHPIIDLYAYKGMQLIAGSIVNAVQNGDDERSRTDMALGSLYGGICLGPVNTAAVHALSYPLGSMFHLPHGLSNALLLPYVMDYNLVASPARHAQVALAVGCKDEGDDRATAKKGVEKIKDLIRNCGLPLQLREAGVTAQSITQMAREAMKIQRLLKNNPREVTEKDAIDIYQTAF